LGLGLAILLRGAPGEGAFKNIIFLPRILAPTVVGVLWFYVYAPDGVLKPYPGQRTLSLAVFMYFEAFQKGGWAFGSAIAVVIGIVVLSVTWIQAAMQARIDKMTK